MPIRLNACEHAATGRDGCGNFSSNFGSYVVYNFGERARSGARERTVDGMEGLVAISTACVRGENPAVL